MMTCFRTNRGFTLIELIAVIVIIGILATVAIRKFTPVAETFMVEETRQEMDQLAAAIIGNPEWYNNGTRSDFGYVGDVGSLPPNLDALVTNPGYGTWKGPYIGNDLEQVPNDYKRDAWQSDYIYTGGVTITSTGSGSSIDRRLAGSANHILLNTVSGNIFDLDGTPPGNDYIDSLSAQLYVPDGAGGVIMKTSPVDPGGYFIIDSVPIGNHDLEIIYNPDHDTLHRFVTVLPKSDAYGEYYLGTDVWTAGGGGSGGIEWVADSDTLLTGNCSRLFFCVANYTGAPLTVSSMTLTWGTPAAYYQLIRWDGSIIRNGNPALGSGDMATFSAQTINDSQQVCVEFTEFHSNPSGGGSPVNMAGTTFTIDFSDGSSITFVADVCN